MSRIQAKPLFSLAHKTLYKWKLSHSIALDSVRDSVDQENRRLILITSSDPALAANELRFTRANFFGLDYKSVLCVIPLVAWNELDGLPANWTSVPYALEHVTRFGFPAQSFLKKINQRPGSVSMLLSHEPDPFSELLFTNTTCPQRVAFYQDILQPHATLLVTPRSAADQKSAMHLLFASLQTFLPLSKEQKTTSQVQ